MAESKPVDNSFSDDENEHEEEVEEISVKPTALSNIVKARVSVSAEVYGQYNKKGDFKPRVIAKNSEQKARILEKLNKAFMFANLENKEKNIIIDAMDIVKVSEGQWVIKQGDDGDNLYVVDHGELDCFKSSSHSEQPAHLKTYYSGEAFGELALLYNAPRAASIQAKTDSVLFALDRETFNNIVKEAEVKRREKFEATLSKIELLDGMDPYEKTKIADVVSVEKFRSGDTVITQGAEGTKFYFIEDGTAVATKVLTGKTEEEEVYKYSTGDYFGELALLKNEPRAANIRATSDLTLLALERDTFNRILGPLNDILKRNTQKYEKFI